MVTRELEGSHLGDFDYKAQGWSKDHIRWLEQCKTTWISWTVKLESYSAALPPLTEGYSAAAKSTASTTTTGT